MNRLTSQKLKSFPSALYGLTVLVLGPIGLSACDSASMFTALKTILADSGTDAGKLRGQVYNAGAASFSFSGTKTGIQIRMRMLVPWQCLCTAGHMFSSFAAFQLLEACQV